MKKQLKIMKLKFFRVILFFSLSIIYTSIFSQGVIVDRIEAVVDNKIILLSDVRNQVELLKTQGELDIENIECEVLDNLLISKLLVAQAVRDSIEVFDEEVDEELDRKINYYISMIGSVEKFEDYYGKSVEQIKEDFREDIREQLLTGRMREKIIGEVRPTPAEVRAYFEKIPTDSLPYFSKEMEVSQVVIKAKISEEQEKAAKEKAQELRDRIVDEGEDFDILASLYSEDPGSASKGGELGFAPRGSYVPEFERAGYILQVGQVSEVIRSQFGYHIIKLNERRGELFNFSHILIKPVITSYDLQKAKRRIDSVYNKLIVDSLTFFNAVKLYSQDEMSKKMGGVVVNMQTGGSVLSADDMEPAMFFVADTLEIGEISSPQPFYDFEGNQGFRILKLINKKEPHIANLQDDYDKVFIAAKSHKQDEKLKDWIKKRAAKTYISLNDEYADCKNIRNWLNK